MLETAGRTRADRPSAPPVRAAAGPGGPAAHLLALQRQAGNRAVTHVVQRLDPDFQVTGQSKAAAGTPTSIFFDRDSAAITPAEDAKISAFGAVPLAFVTLKGFSSEDETGRPALVDDRLKAVEKRLQSVSIFSAMFGGLAGSPTKVTDLASGEGRLDYRGIRRVEILVAGAASSVPNCSAGADIDPGPPPNVFSTAYDAATTALLPAALTALAKPNDPPAKQPLKQLFGGPANAPRVAAGLGLIAAHFPNMLPHIPLNDKTAAGHRVINACEGDVLAYNQGTGPSARMTVGPSYAAIADANERGLILIHEGSHGATGLVTEDKAYRWQRLLEFLPPAVALKNADSYTQFVRLILDPSAVGSERKDDASTLPAARQRSVREAVAWLEQWLVQGRLELRSLYSAAHTANKGGAWHADDEWYRDHTYKQVSDRFGVTAPPGVPTLDDKTVIAGVYDRLFQLRVALTTTDLALQAGSPNAWEAGPGPKVTLAPAFLVAGKRAKVETLLGLIVQAATFIESGRKAGYVSLVKDMAPGFGGP